MKILAFESSGKSGSVALVEDGKVLCQIYQNLGSTHSKTLMPMLEDLEKIIDTTDVDMIAVANGPGSYTGVRIGVSVVQGLSIARNKPCLGVSTLKSLAYNIPHFEGLSIISVMDARAGQVYAAVFTIENGQIHQSIEDCAIKITDLISILKNNEKSYILVGDGAEICYNDFKQSNINVSLAPEYVRYQSAVSVALACAGQQAHTVDTLIPRYLRPSQAEREKNGG